MSSPLVNSARRPHGIRGRGRDWRQRSSERYSALLLDSQNRHRPGSLFMTNCGVDMSETRATCPGCGDKGRRVPRITPLSLLLPTPLARLEQAVGASDLRFCGRRDCEVVYFGGLEPPFRSADLRVPVLQKSDDPGRYACYCFSHTVASIIDEVRLTGTSQVPELIADKCRQGLDRCEVTNPQGRCCLGNIRAIVKEARAGAPAEATSRAQASVAAEVAVDCCAPTPRATTSPPPRSTEPGRRLGLWSAGGAVVAAILASACCWLPLTLIGLGGSAVGVAGFFEAYRGWFLGAAGLMLALGFYLVYFRRPRCAPGEACEAPRPRLQRANRILLWSATVLVLAFSTFPDYFGVLSDGRDSYALSAAPGGVTRTYAIEGMTCEGCSGLVRDALTKLPGVTAVDVLYSEKQARVHFARNANVNDGAVLRAVASLGYQGSPPAVNAR